jgi:16S rRNA (guanine(966)-N(2))-methyltransferase RsmD
MIVSHQLCCKSIWFLILVFSSNALRPIFKLDSPLKFIIQSGSFKSSIRVSSTKSPSESVGLTLKKLSRNRDIDPRTFKRREYAQNNDKQEQKSSSNNRLKKQGIPLVDHFNPNNLKILGGLKKGMKIDSPTVYLRPMMSKVRSAIFSSLSSIGLFESNTTRVLDVFSGSGSVGLEALSRGATHSTFVDMSTNCIETCRRNAKRLGFEQQISTACAKAEDVFQEPSIYGLNDPYQLISITPPYEEVDYNLLINLICNSSLVTSNSIVIIEYPIEMGTLPFIIGDRQLIGLRNRRYGRTVLALYVFKPFEHFDFHEEEFCLDSIRKKKPS